MTTKIVEVIAKILEGLNKNHTLEEVSRRLSKEKFDKQTVSAAFSLVFDKVLSKRISAKERKSQKSKNFRIFSEEERDILGIDNFNYINHLLNIGLLDVIDYEMIIEQLMLFPQNQISKEDINWLVLLSLVDFNLDTLPGSRLLLYSSDTIN